MDSAFILALIQYRQSVKGFLVPKNPTIHFISSGTLAYGQIALGSFGNGLVSLKISC